MPPVEAAAAAAVMVEAVMVGAMEVAVVVAVGMEAALMMTVRNTVPPKVAVMAQVGVMMIAVGIPPEHVEDMAIPSGSSRVA